MAQATALSAICVIAVGQDGFGLLTYKVMYLEEVSAKTSALVATIPDLGKQCVAHADMFMKEGLYTHAAQAGENVVYVYTLTKDAFVNLGSNTKHYALMCVPSSIVPSIPTIDLGITSGVKSVVRRCIGSSDTLATDKSEEDMVVIPKGESGAD
jgi:hypothetical protein